MYSAVFKVKVFSFAKSCLFCCFYGYFIEMRIEKLTSFFLDILILVLGEPFQTKSNAGKQSIDSQGNERRLLHHRRFKKNDFRNIDFIRFLSLK